MNDTASTPRTDAAILNGTGWNFQDTVLADFARELECELAATRRENNALAAERDAAKEEHQQLLDTNRHLEQKLDAANANQKYGWETARESHKVYEKEHQELLAMREEYRRLLDTNRHLEEKLDAANRERDELAAKLKEAKAAKEVELQRGQSWCAKFIEMRRKRDSLLSRVQPLVDALTNLRSAISDFKGHGMPGFTDRATGYITMQEADAALALWNQQQPAAPKAAETPAQTFEQWKRERSLLLGTGPFWNASDIEAAWLASRTAAEAEIAALKQNRDELLSEICHVNDHEAEQHAKHLSETDALTAEIARLTKERDEADRKAGAAERALELAQENFSRTLEAKRGVAKSVWATHEQQFAEQEKELAELREDKARLDWLEQGRHADLLSCDCKGGFFVEDYYMKTTDTIRAAIDAARVAQKHGTANPPE